LRVYTNVSTELLTYAVGVAPVLNVSLMNTISFHAFTAVFAVVSAMTTVNN